MSGGRRAGARIAQAAPDAVATDAKMPGGAGGIAEYLGTRCDAGAAVWAVFSVVPGCFVASGGVPDRVDHCSKGSEGGAQGGTWGGGSGGGTRPTT